MCVLCCAKSLQSCPTLCDPVDCSPLGSLSMGFSRQEYWSGLPCLRQGVLYALAGEFFPAETPGKPCVRVMWAIL